MSRRETVFGAGHPQKSSFIQSFARVKGIILIPPGNSIFSQVTGTNILLQRI